MSNLDSLDVLRSMMNTYSIRYIVAETNYTRHHIERLMPTCKDRGKWKWSPEPSFPNVHYKTDEDAKRHVEESLRSNIDGADLFPRLYFFDSSFLAEFGEWLRVRDLKLIDIKAPSI